MPHVGHVVERQMYVVSCTIIWFCKKSESKDVLLYVLTIVLDISKDGRVGSVQGELFGAPVS